MTERIPYTHTAIEAQEPVDAAKVWRRILRNTYQFVGGEGSRVYRISTEVAGALNEATKAEATRRAGFYHYYSRQVGEAAIKRLLVVDPALGSYRPESMVLDFAARIHTLERNDMEAGYELKKGISCEIAHVIQGGDWEAVATLDAVMDEMVGRDALENDDRTLRLTERYARSPERARTRMHPVDFSLDGDRLTPYGLIVRNRAYADYGDLRVIRRSSYLASPTLMDEDALAIHEALLATDDRNFHKVYAAEALKRFVTSRSDNRAREEDSSVLPVQTAYFLLHRHGGGEAGDAVQ